MSIELEVHDIIFQRPTEMNPCLNPLIVYHSSNMVTWKYDSPSFVDRDASDMQILPTRVHELSANSYARQRLLNGHRPQKLETKSSIYPQPMLPKSHRVQGI